MRREIPMAITFLIGIVLLTSYYFTGTLPGTSWTLANIAKDITSWGVVVSAFAVGLAAVNLMRIHGNKIARKRPDWVHSVALLFTMAAFIVVGVFNKHYPTNKTASTLFRNMFDNIYSPLGAAMFAIIAFYVASASYRAFRARSTEATFLLAAAILVMLGSAPIGALMWGQFPIISKWLLDVVNTSGQRGLAIGLAIGGFAASIRILLGLDRGHLGE